MHLPSWDMSIAGRSRCRTQARNSWMAHGPAVLFCAVPLKQGNSADLKPKPFPLTVLGVRVEVPVNVSFDAHSDADVLVLQDQGRFGQRWLSSRL